MRGAAAWLRVDPRGELILAIVILLMLAGGIAVWATTTGRDPFYAGEALGILGAVVLAVFNGRVLRRRGRRLRWLLLYLLGLGLVPLLVALWPSRQRA